jgi:hypothetical protein
VKHEDIERLLPLPKSSRRKTWYITISTLFMAWTTIILIILTQQVSGAGILAVGMVSLIATSVAAWSAGGAWDYRVFKELFSVRADLLAAAVTPAPATSAPPPPPTPEQKKADETLPPAGPIQEEPK